MATFSIDLDTSKNEVYIEGDIKLLQKNRFAWRYVKDYLNPRIEDYRLSIEIGDENPISILSKISDFLKKYGFDEKKGPSSEQLLHEYYEEKRKFEEFSKKALLIRNNNCDPIEFKEFTDSISLNLPARKLYPLQLLSAYHMAFSQNSCNFSVPGAGKTSVVYGAYAYLKNLQPEHIKKIDHLLIVGPLSSFGPWESEFNECFGRLPQSKRLIATLSKEERKDYLYSRRPAEITLISYASVTSLQKELQFFLRKNKVMVVLDEAHKIKNVSGGVTAQAVLSLAKTSKARVILTGTPAPNGYQDLYNLFQFIWPSKNVIGFQINQLFDITEKGDTNRVTRLVDNISPFFMRIKKSDLNIPAAINHPPIYVNMGPIQQRIYDFVEKKYMDAMIDEGSIDTTSNFKALLAEARVIRLMQAATNPAMLKTPLENFLQEGEYPHEAFQAIDDNNVLKSIADYEVNETPAKYVEIKKIIEHLLSRNEKVVVWATFINTILGLKEYLSNHDINSQELYGAIPIERDGLNPEESYQELTRERIIKEFQSPNCPYSVIIANPFAVAESISLHKACHNAIYIERSFNAAHFVQSKDRIHRFGLKPGTDTHYYYLLSRNTIDETIDERLRSKERRMIEIMESQPIPLFDNASENLGDEDIKAIIRDYVRRIKKT